MDMADARKFYIATGKDDARRKAAFPLLGRDFSSASCIEEAEFVILDCDDPPLPKEWVNRNANFVIPDACTPPLILTGKDPRSYLATLANLYNGDVTVLHLCENEQDLVQTLKRLQSALPFYNSRNAPDKTPEEKALEKVIRSLALSIQRS
jgi:hypothetical protein